MKLSDAARFSVRNLLEARLFFATNVIAIGTGVFLVVIMSSIATGISRYVEQLLKKEVGATMIEVTFDKRSSAQPLTAPRLAQLERDPRIAAVTPVVQGVFAELRQPGQPEAFISLWSTTGGSDPETLRYSYLAGSPAAPGPQTMIIPQSVAAELHIFPATNALGRQVVLRVTRSSAHGDTAWELPFRVTAVARETRFSRCYVALSVMESLASWQAGAPRGTVNTPFVYDTALVYARRLQDVSSIRSDIEARGYRTASILDTVRRYREITRMIAVILGALGGIALFTGSVSIFNTAWAAVMRRIKEFAVYKTYGASRRAIMTVVLIEAAITSAVAALAGFGLAALGRLLIRRIIAADVGFDLMPIEPFLLGIAFLVSALACIGASIIPALRAARLSPGEALRSA